MTPLLPRGVGPPGKAAGSGLISPIFYIPGTPPKTCVEDYGLSAGQGQSVPAAVQIDIEEPVVVPLLRKILAEVRPPGLLPHLAAKAVILVASTML